MKYRKLGNTELMISEISFGTIPILSGNIPVLPDYYSPNMDQAIEIMKCAFLLGCNFFDTAIVPEYGDAELKLGRFAKQVGRKNIIISDKARFFDGNDMYKAVEESCKNLGTYADIYFVHQVDEKNQDIVFSKNGALSALNELKMEGKIKFAGVASHYYEILLRGVKDPRVDVLQGSGNILERGMLERMEKEPLFRKKGFILNKVYAAGVLPQYFSIKTLLSGVLSFPISSALIGLGTIEQVKQVMQENMGNYRIPLDSVISVLEKSFSPILCDRCQRCRCVNGIEIHIIFRQYNYYYLGKEYWALRKLDLNIQECAEQCKKCIEMSCVRDCPKSIDIPRMIQMISQFAKIHIRNSKI